MVFWFYIGGLIVFESDNNFWYYKFIWNLCNVVFVGQGIVQYLENGKYKYIFYNCLFKEYWVVDIFGMGEFEVYVNCDFLFYCEVYGFLDIFNIFWGIICYWGFCDVWNVLVKIGLIDGFYFILESEQVSYYELMEGYFSFQNKLGFVCDCIVDLLKLDFDDEVMQKLDWLGFFCKKKVGLVNVMLVLILENLFMEKWKFEFRDKDMIIMQYEFEYELEGKKKELIFILVMKGMNFNDIVMAKLVGLFLGIFVKLVMEGCIEFKGVNIFVIFEVYEFVLDELEQFGVVFKDEVWDF